MRRTQKGGHPENPFQQALFHTDAGIAHDELEIGAIAHPPGFPDAEVHAAPFRGKFQRIGQNIDKHLIEAQGIAPVALVHHAFERQCSCFSLADR